MYIIPVVLIGLLRGISGSNPVISPSPTASAAEGQNVTFTCTYSGSETVSAYSWKKDGTVAGTIQQGCTPFVAINTTLYGYDCFDNRFTWTIKQVSQANNGDKWRCEVLIGGGYSSSQESTIVIIVLITSVTMTTPTVTTVSVIENTPSAQFVCITSAGIPQAVITWYRKSATSSTGDVEINGGNTETSMDANSLTIVTGKLSYSPSRDIQGWQIYCNASNVENHIKMSTRKPTLNVLYVPVVQSLSDICIVEGSALSRTCVVTPGNPTQTPKRWTRSKGGLTQTSTTLTIASVQQDDDDTYTCTAFNTMSPTEGMPQTGSATASFRLLCVLYPPTTPTFTINSVSVSATTSVIQGTNIRVTCTSSSNPSPTYRWNTGVTNDVLPLNNIQTPGGGNYTCTVTNTMTPTGEGTVSGAKFSTIYI